ncbi:hypothetical protein XaplCFBP3123_15280 [Xanthomonas arboricola pv. populi]|nr:hypothetical protein XaplCFBP3123_15280 [Xanthomonas arboricola pv. populi]
MLTLPGAAHKTTSPIVRWAQRTSVDLRPGCRALSKTVRTLSGAVSSPVAGSLAAWMPPTSPEGWVRGVSREW